MADTFFGGLTWEAGKFVGLVVFAVVLGKWRPWRWLPRVFGR